MMHIVSPGGMRALENAAFEKGATALELMETAAEAVRDTVDGLLGGLNGRRVLVVCGPGNNGGDGMAAARLMAQKGCAITVWIAGQVKTPEAAENLKRLDGQCAIEHIANDCTFEQLEKTAPEPDAVVDALFGTGFSKKPEGVYHHLIRWINVCGARVVLAVDIPSGMDGKTGCMQTAQMGAGCAPCDAPCCVRATHTLALGYPKFGLYLTRHKAYVGKILNAPFEWPKDCGLGLLDGTRDRAHCLIPSDLAAILPARDPDTHKGSAGRVLVYAGSPGMAGAAAMAAKAALCAGAGLVTVACERELIPVLQCLVPNAMCVEIDEAVKNPPAHDVLAAGCGIGQSAKARDRLLALLKKERGTVVLDADGLNLLAREAFPLPENTVLTPHVGEAARLLQVTADETANDMLGAVKALYDKYQRLIVLKSAATVIYDGAGLYLNTVGTPALAKGGSGDALCGIIAALLADEKNREMLNARLCAAVGCLWLGMAGRLAAQKHGDRSALTGDVIDELGPAWLESLQMNTSDPQNGGPQNE